MTASYKSPMPGFIYEVKVKKDQEVKTGDVLVILESMKMLMEIKADKDGTVEQVNTQIGDRVKQEQLLIVLK